MECKELKNYLLNTLVPFWLNLEDKECGGVINYMNNEGEIDRNHERYILLLARNLYFFSATYGETKDERCKNIAKRYLQELKLYFDADGGLNYILDSNKNVLDKTKNVYFQSFGIYALSEYALAFDDEESKKLALDLFFYVEDNFKSGMGYIEQLDGENLIADCGVEATRSMNAVLHILEAYTVLHDVTKNKIVAEAVKNLLALIEEKVFNEKLNRLEVFFDDEYNTLSNYHSYGHDIEASWLIDKAVESVGDEKCIKEINSITTKLAEEVRMSAFDGEALINESVDGVIDTDRIWWVQAEGVVGYYKKYKQTCRGEYKEVADKLLEFIFKNQISPLGEWYWKLDKNNVPDNGEPMVSPWKCPYHNGRMIVELIKCSKGV